MIRFVFYLDVLGQTPLSHSGQFPLEIPSAGSVNKILVLLLFCPYFQGFRRKKDLAELLLQGLNLIFNFAYWLLNSSTY